MFISVNKAKITAASLFPAALNVGLLKRSNWLEFHIGLHTNISKMHAQNDNKIPQQ